MGPVLRGEVGPKSVAVRNRSAFRGAPTIRVRVRRTRMALRCVRGSSGRDPRYGASNATAQVNRCGKQVLVRSRGVEVQVVTRRPAPKTTIGILGQIGGETSTLPRGRTVDWAMSPQFFSGSFLRNCTLGELEKQERKNKAARWRSCWQIALPAPKFRHLTARAFTGRCLLAWCGLSENPRPERSLCGPRDLGLRLFFV